MVPASELTRSELFKISVPPFTLNGLPRVSNQLTAREPAFVPAQVIVPGPSFCTTIEDPFALLMRLFDDPVSGACKNVRMKTSATHTKSRTCIHHARHG